MNNFLPRLNIKLGQLFFGLLVGILITSFTLGTIRTFSESDSKSVSNSDSRDDYGVTSPGYDNKGEVAGPEDKMISTSYLNIEVTDSLKTVEDVKAYLKTLNGYIESLTTYTSDMISSDVYYKGQEKTNHSKNDVISYTIFLRVPSKDFQTAISHFKGYGDVLNYSESNYNVAEQYTDTKSRLDVYLNKRDRLQALMKEAKDINDLVALETALTETIQQIENYQTQINQMDKEINYSGISLNIMQKQEASIKELDNGFGDLIKTAFINSINNFLKVCVGILTGFIYIIPFAVLIGLVYLVFRFVQNSKK